MVQKNKLRKSFIFVTIFLFFGISIAPVITGDIESQYQTPHSINNDFELDLQYIYSITENLSNIIFTEYNESAGEIAKGRAFGTKGEHKAAEIIFDNMTKLGLYTIKDPMKNNEKYPKTTHEVEIMDYFVKINNKTVDSYIAPVWIKTSENNHNLDFTYNYTNLKVIKPPISPFIYMLRNLLSGKIEPFVIILKDTAFYPYGPLSIFPFYDNFYFNLKIRQLHGGAPLVYSWLWDKYSKYCKGIILYDFNKDVHNMNIIKYYNHMPVIHINGSDGGKILNDIHNTRVDFKLEQRLNTSVISYNVIGQLNGTDPSKTVLIDCLYDSWWCQGTADSAIGMAMVLAIAKYFVEQNITPKYTIKFIAFGGEEHGFCAGSKYHESTYTEDDIIYVIDLNQLGFKQEDPKLTLEIICNKLGFLSEIWPIIKESDYVDRVESSDEIKPIWMRDGGPSNSRPFALNRKNCKTVCFLKNTQWKLHHRDGQNHTEGDVLNYFDPQDVNVTGEIILNVIKYLIVDE